MTVVGAVKWQGAVQYGSAMKKPRGVGTNLVTCSRKVRYGHRATALNAIAKMAEKGITGLPEYPCACCLGWHIGHKMTIKVTVFLTSNAR